MRKILWVDVEATGLDPQIDVILEVGLRITDWEGHELDRTTSLVWTRDWRARIAVNELVMDMHATSGLMFDLEDLDNNQSKRYLKGSNQVSSNLVVWVQQRLGHDAHNIMPMAGNSVHYDRSFLLAHMPDLHNLWHYRNLDISSLRESCRLFNPSLFAKMPTPVNAHRPQADIDESIKLMNWLQENFMFVED